LAEQLSGRAVSDEELAAAIGALGGSEVTIRPYLDRGLLADIKHPEIELQQRRIFRNEHGELEVTNLYFEKKLGARRGIGIESFLTQVNGATALGIKSINTFAAGRNKPNALIGYYVWARFGFNAPLEANDLRKLPKKYAQVRTLNDLMLLGGHRWWRTHGTERNMSFDLHPDSSSMQVLTTYAAELKKQGRL
jgi:hypothetical protein